MIPDIAAGRNVSSSRRNSRPRSTPHPVEAGLRHDGVTDTATVPELQGQSHATPSETVDLAGDLGQLFKGHPSGDRAASRASGGWARPGDGTPQ